MKNKYTPEQKKDIIERHISGGETYSQINADTGIAKSTFYSWNKKYNVEKETTKKKTVNFRNFMLLENKVARLENMVDILKSVGCIEDIPLRKKLLSPNLGVQISMVSSLQAALHFFDRGNKVALPVSATGGGRALCPHLRCSGSSHFNLSK